MSKEFEGYINNVYREGEYVVKVFEDKGLTERVSVARKRAEIKGLQRKNVDTPRFIAAANNKVIMSYVSGEKNLDLELHIMPDQLRESLLQEAGGFLRNLHDHSCFEVFDGYHSFLIKDMLSRINILEADFNKNRIDPDQLKSYILSEYDSKKVDQTGLVYTHGDFWVNNLIFQQNRNGFKNSVGIDWEMGQIASPYVDFAVVELSIENQHESTKEHFWRGYGGVPDKKLKRFFAIRQILVWMNGEEDRDFSSEFYRQKLDIIKLTI